MKTLRVVLSLVFFGSVSATAFDTPKNPDRYVSMGFDVTGAHQPQAFPGYTALSTDGTNRIIQTDSERDSRTMTLDLRLPTFNWLTLEAHGGNWREQVGSEHTNGYTFGGGFRVYFAGLDD